jgi:predicted phosphodiesterase
VPQWREEVAIGATKVRESIRSQPADDAATKAALDAMRPFFQGFLLYAMIIPCPRRGYSEEVLAEFEKLDGRNGRVALVLSGRLRRRTIEIPDPQPPFRALADRPIAAPCAVLWTAQRACCVFSEDELLAFLRKELPAMLGAGDEAALEALTSEFEKRRKGQAARRILHLSDFHFGDRRVQERKHYLASHLRRVLPSVDRVVVTGDLCDEPKPIALASYREFCSDLEQSIAHDLITVPGNHDARRKGNSLWKFGRKHHVLIEHEWGRLVVDHDIRCVFFCFNSCKEGDWARGFLSEIDRLTAAAFFERRASRFPAITDYTRIALIHHHLYPFASDAKTGYGRLLEKIFGGDERFVALENPGEVLDWCARRNISLVLHGHKHKPFHMSEDFLLDGYVHPIATIGCGTSTGVEGAPMSYNVVTLDSESDNWSVRYFADFKGDGGGFLLHAVAISTGCEVRFDDETGSA